jgi:hypothetical protein
MDRLDFRDLVSLAAVSCQRIARDPLPAAS